MSKSLSFQATILLVEDDHGLRNLLQLELEEAGLEVIACGSAEDAARALRQQAVDAIISDLRLPGMDALQLLEQAKKLEFAPAFLVITAFGTVARAVEALKAGADDFLTKPLDLDHLKLSLHRALETRKLRQDLKNYRELLDDEDRFHGMIGRSTLMRRMFQQIRQLARASGAVLITGESGTGKELVAGAIHRESQHSTGPYIAVNCAGIPKDLMESEFFGHAEGAFTGAGKARQGLLSEADGGSLLLDEISEMPIELQAKLLRVLEDGKVRPIGESTEKKIDVRIIASTNREIEEEIKKGHFREDLFFRLETFRIHVPPLRDRDEDLDILIAYFIHKFSRRLDKNIKGISPEALNAMKRYPFPGNVRELQNAIERAVAFCADEEIQCHHLPDRITGNKNIPMQTDPETRATGFPPDEVILPLGQVEAAYIRSVLEKVGGNKRRAAALLGIGRRTLYRKLESNSEDAG
ncbi:MAG TPA: sigma-54 dependent transcriptional regulator [Acidobacteriota bacterium]|nr:sigma-54 dependent transcriptional regulator [Acidobacteriota bacterium]